MAISISRTDADRRIACAKPRNEVRVLNPAAVVRHLEDVRVHRRQPGQKGSLWFGLDITGEQETDSFGADAENHARIVRRRTVGGKGREARLGGEHIDGDGANLE